MCLCAKMRPLSSLGIGLSLVFGCLLLALFAELYYLFWWKKRIAHRDIERDYVATAEEFPCLFCWKRPSSFTSTVFNPQEVCAGVRATGDSDDGEDSLESELMKLHNLCGPPRILFTIKEETKEDLESEDGKSRGGRSRRDSRGRSLGELLVPVETPFLTPQSSPPFFTPPLTPLDCYNQHGFNPLFESSKEDVLKRMGSSPPPKFKFLKDAEEKLYRKILMEEALKVYKNGDSAVEDIARPPGSGAPAIEVSPSPSRGPEEEDGSYITILIGKNRDKGHQNQHHSSSSQVTPLSSSPSSIRTSNGKLISHLCTKQ